MTSPAEVPLSVIWGKENYDITLVIANGVLSFKKELEELTGVPADRMKLMPKSKGKRGTIQKFRIFCTMNSLLFVDFRLLSHFCF